MPQQSRYSTTDFEALMVKVIDTLESNHADRDLSLMVLGNVVTHIINTRVAEHNRAAFTERFCSALKQSIAN